MSDEITKFGKLKEIPMREVWAHEAGNFTPWLAENISELGETLGLTLHAKQEEHPVGNFSLDLLAEDENGHKVAIENQFNATDHDHLGKCLTYAAGCDASIVIWVVETVRDEHRATIEWLNRKTDGHTHFYLVRVSVIKIDDSLPAYQFIPIVSPHNVCSEYFDEFSRDLKEKGFSYPLHQPGDKTACNRQYDSGICHGEYASHKFYYGHEIYDGVASVYLAFYYAKKEKGERLKKKLLSLNPPFEFESADEWPYRFIGTTRKGSFSFSDSKESLAETRAWAVENMLKLAEAVPPEMLQEIADAVEEQENESA